MNVNDQSQADRDARLTVTKVVFELEARINITFQKSRLTVTKVVFEFILPPNFNK